MDFKLLSIPPKILVPLGLCLWLAAALLLSALPTFSEAATVTDPACSSNWSQGVWGMKDSPAHLSLLGGNTCYKTTGTLVWGEWWKDTPGDSYGCQVGNTQTAYTTCSDEDMNWYLKLSKSELNAAGVTKKEIQKLQRWSECKAGSTNTANWCNFLTETIPQGGNYQMWNSSNTPNDPNPTDEQSQLPIACLDEDFNPATTESNPCKGKNITISYTGPRVFDNNHGWKEVHPVRKESFGGSSYCVDDTHQTDPTQQSWKTC
jgi:hypothetical protein